jgi:hypothetical protein
VLDVHVPRCDPPRSFETGPVRIKFDRQPAEVTIFGRIEDRRRLWIFRTKRRVKRGVEENGESGSTRAEEHSSIESRQGHDNHDTAERKAISLPRLSPLSANIGPKFPQAAGGWKRIGGINAYALVEICVGNQCQRTLGQHYNVQ